MTAFNTEAIESIRSASEATAAEAADAFSRAFDQKITLEVGEGNSLDPAGDLSAWNKPGLAIVLNVESEAALLMIADESGLLPNWYTAPDPTGESKLATLGQELGMTLLPEELMAMEFEVGAVENLAGAVEKGALGDQPAKLSIQLTSEENTYDAWLVWPLTAPQAALADSAAESPETTSEAATSAPPAAQPTSPTPVAPSSPTPASRIQSFAELPSYSRSLLKIDVPIRVILATKKMRVSDIVNIGEGTIIQFNKSCEDTLDVEIKQQKIAEGEAVKVGDKFGVRVTNIIMPDERYIALKARKRVR